MTHQPRQLVITVGPIFPDYDCIPLQIHVSEVIQAFLSLTVAACLLLQAIDRDKGKKGKKGKGKKKGGKKKGGKKGKKMKDLTPDRYWFFSNKNC